MSARRAALGAAIAVLTLLGVTGCGTDHGQANALTACHQYASAKGGGLTPSGYTAKLGQAVRWAGKASKQSAQWDTLKSSLSRIEVASTRTQVSAATSAALNEARQVIDSSCVLAARGY